MAEVGYQASALRPAQAAGGSVGDFLALMKPRVMSLVVFTAFVGLVAAPVTINPLLAVIAILAIAIGAGASGAAAPGMAGVNGELTGPTASGERSCRTARRLRR